MQALRDPGATEPGRITGPRFAALAGITLVTVTTVFAWTRPLPVQAPTASATAVAEPVAVPGAVSASATLAPAVALTPYDSAARRFRVSPAVLRALHQVESNAAGDGCLPNATGSGAVGPMQFKRETFQTYGVDGNGDGQADICGAVDSIFSAANFLRGKGADAEMTSAATRDALVAYGTDVERVLALAEHLERNDR
ncbi:MAG: lytic transglycosylase domain-containing protein [Chloroflexota bacterium]